MPGSFTGERNATIIGGNGSNAPGDTHITLVILNPNATYHYRLKLTDSTGNATYGADVSFATAHQRSGMAAKLLRQHRRHREHGPTSPHLLDTAFLNFLNSPRSRSLTTSCPTRAHDLDLHRWQHPAQPSPSPASTFASDLTYEAWARTILAALGPPSPAPVEAWASASPNSAIPAWSPNPSFLNLQPGLNGYPTGTVTVTVFDTVPMSDTTRRFMRLKVTR